MYSIITNLTMAAPMGHDTIKFDSNIFNNQRLLTTNKYTLVGNVSHEGVNQRCVHCRVVLISYFQLIISLDKSGKFSVLDPQWLKMQMDANESYIGIH